MAQNPFPLKCLIHGPVRFSRVRENTGKWEIGNKVSIYSIKEIHVNSLIDWSAILGEHPIWSRVTGL